MVKRKRRKHKREDGTVVSRAPPQRDDGTPETRAKLVDDPLQAIIEQHIPHEWRVPCERAADEIRAIYAAITVQLTLRGQRLAREARGRYEIPDDLAEAHRDRYIPWTQATDPKIVDWVLCVVVDREPLPNAGQRYFAGKAIIDYARRF